MKLENVTVVLNEYLEGKDLKEYLPVTPKLMMICAALLLVDDFIALTAEVHAVADVLFLIFGIGTLARGEFFSLTIGFSLRFVDYIYNLLYFTVRWNTFSGASAVYAVFYVILLFMAYKKSKELGMVPDKIEKKVTEVSGKAQETYNNVSSSVKANVDDVMTLHHDEEQAEPLPAEEAKEADSQAADAAENRSEV